METLLSKKELLENFYAVTKNYPDLCYDVSITTPAEKTRFVKERRPNKNTEHIDITNNNVKSVIVFSFFTHVAADYYPNKVILPEVISHLNTKYKERGVCFYGDGYILDRKQYALRSGVGKLSKPSIVFHNEYGLNSKLELLFCSHEFDEMTVVDKTLIYENCVGCSAPCETNCPQSCRMNYSLVDWEKCKNFVDTQWLFDNPDQMCRMCQESCPFSEELKHAIKQKNKNYGQYMDPRFLHLNDRV